MSASSLAARPVGPPDDMDQPKASRQCSSELFGAALSLGHLQGSAGEEAMAAFRSTCVALSPQNEDPYDEQLQEDVYLGKLKANASPLEVPQVKNTFIHYNVNNFTSGFGSMASNVFTQNKFESAPPVILEKSFHTKYPNMEEEHMRGECRPCAYHVFKQDGCRNGNNCQFCHLCTRGQIKLKKKERAKSLKQQVRGGTGDLQSGGRPSDDDDAQDRTPTI